MKRPEQRRKAYDSTEVRGVRTGMADLHRVEVLSRSQEGARCGSWTRPLELLCAKLRRSGMALPEVSLGEVRLFVVQELGLAKKELARLGQAMRRERHMRWRDALPGLWRERPGVIHHWLQAPGTA